MDFLEDHISYINAPIAWNVIEIVLNYMLLSRDSRVYPLIMNSIFCSLDTFF